MATKKQAKVEQMRRKHSGQNLYIFEWKKREGVRVGGHIGSVVADDLTTAVKRLLSDQRTMGQMWQLEVMKRLIKNKKFSKYVRCTKKELDKPSFWEPAEPP